MQMFKSRPVWSGPLSFCTSPMDNETAQHLRKTTDTQVDSSCSPPFACFPRSHALDLSSVTLTPAHKHLTICLVGIATRWSKAHSSLRCQITGVWLVLPVETSLGKAFFFFNREANKCDSALRSSSQFDVFTVFQLKKEQACFQCNKAKKITQDNYLWLFLCFPNNSL